MCPAHRRARASLTRLALAVALGGAAQAALAADDPAQDAYGLSGNWGGARDRLKDEGWTFQIGEKHELAGLASGGRELTTGAGEFDVGATADLGKLAGLPGGKVEVTLTQRHGADLGPNTGRTPLMQYQEVYGRGDIWRLTQFAYSQDLPAGFNVKLGRLNPGADFDAFACDFQNLTFCGAVPGNLAGDYWQNWPVSQWGARLKWKDKAAYVQAGAYQVSERNLRHGFDLSFGGGEGVLVPFEAGWTPALGPRGLPGTYVLGGWWSNVKAPDLLLAQDGLPQPLTSAPPLQRRNRDGVYVSIQQQLTGTAKGKGLSVFLNATKADARTTRLDRQVAAGLSFKGLIPGRPKDEIALAVGQTHISDRAARAAALAGPAAPVLRSEDVVEVDYRLAVVEGLKLTPNVQYVAHPGGLPGAHATVLGLRTEVKF